MKIQIIEMQSENHPYGDPDQGVPEEALRMFLLHHPNSSEDSCCAGEHEFIIWRDEDNGTFYANAWTLPESGEEREYTTYYEFKVDSSIDPPDDPYFELRDKTMREGALVVSELIAVVYALYPDEEHVETFALTDKLARAKKWLDGLTFMYE